MYTFNAVTGPDDFIYNLCRYLSVYHPSTVVGFAGIFLAMFRTWGGYALIYTLSRQ
jgi:hypothetical protein